MAVDLDPENWSVADSTELYEVTRWGNGYFSIGENGNLYVHPDRSPKRHVDLKQLIDRLQVRVLTPNLRFGEICSIGFKKSIKPFRLQWKRGVTGVTTAVSIQLK